MHTNWHKRAIHVKKSANKENDVTIKAKNLKFKDIQTTKIFVAIRNGNNVKDLLMLDIPVKVGVNIGTPCFNQEMNKVLFTMWEGSNISKDCGIYFSTKSSKGEWSKPKELNRTVNLPKSRSMAPYYLEETGVLYFSSNRPGGFGGYDLWMANLDSSFNASNIVNLGKEINTG